jgi:peptidoglycan/xylan/chitin deacetylase (PgdA/CDA1 family)
MINRALFSLLSSRVAGRSLTILLFHKVPKAADPLTPEEMSAQQFLRIIEFIREHFAVVALDGATQALRNGALPKRALAITFDDGYADWIETAAPILKGFGLPATFFITTEQLEGPALWHERIIAAVRALPERNASLPDGFSRFADLAAPASRIALVKALQERLKYEHLSERLYAIELLESQAVTPLDLPPKFDADAVRALHRQGFAIGAHTVRHPILTKGSQAEAMNEIGGSREILEGVIGGRVRLFAYPNGRPVRDYADEHVAMVKSCGYEAAFATCPGVADASTDPFQLPRFMPWAGSAGRLTFQFARNFVAK